MSQVDDEREGIIKWHALTHSEFWDATAQALAEMRCREANTVCLDYKQPIEVRNAAAGRFEAWAEILGLRKQWEIAYDSIKEADAEADRPEQIVGSELKDQWYAHEEAES